MKAMAVLLAMVIFCGCSPSVELQRIRQDNVSTEKLHKQFERDVQSVFRDTPIVKFEAVGMVERVDDFRFAKLSGNASSTSQRISVNGSYVEVDSEFKLAEIWGIANGKLFNKTYDAGLIGKLKRK